MHCIFAPANDDQEAHCLAGGGLQSGLFAKMWAPDGRSIIFSSIRSGMQANWRISTEGGVTQPETVYPGIGTFSRDGAQLVLETPAGFESSTCIWRFDVSGAAKSLVRSQRLLATTSFDGAAQPSPDNGQIVFEFVRSVRTRSRRPTPMAVTLCSSRRSIAIRELPRWSPDGQRSRSTTGLVITVRSGSSTKRGATRTR